MELTKKKCYLFPDFTSDEWGIYYDHVEICIVFSWDLIGFVEVVEYIARVFVKLLIELSL